MDIAFFTFITSLLLSITSGICTVIGIGNIFTSAPFMTMLIASVIEFGRVVLVYVLHHFWNTMPFIKKLPGIVMLIIAMSLSALGVFGFFSNAYSAKTKEVIPLELEIKRLENEIPLLTIEIENNESQIENIKSIMASKNMEKAIEKYIEKEYITKALSVQSDMREEIDSLMLKNKELNEKIININKQITNLNIESEEKAPTIAHLKYLAKLLGTTNDNAIVIFIVMIMLVFDTLAMYLMITSDWITSKKEEKLKEVIPKKRTIKKKNKSSASDILSELDNILDKVTPKREENPIQKEDAKVIKNNIDMKVSKLVKLLLEDDSVIDNPLFINSLSITPLVVKKLEEELGSDSEIMIKIKNNLKKKKVVR